MQSFNRGCKALKAFIVSDSKSNSQKVAVIAKNEIQAKALAFVWGGIAQTFADLQADLIKNVNLKGLNIGVISEESDARNRGIPI